MFSRFLQEVNEMEYSERIKNLRKSRHLTQEELAKKLDVTKQTISQYERGVRRPDVTTIDALCDFFNVSSDYLLGRADVTVRLVGQYDLMMLDAEEMKDIQFQKLLDYYRQLNNSGQQEAINRLMEMTQLEKYTKK